MIGASVVTGSALETSGCNYALNIIISKKRGILSSTVAKIWKLARRRRL
jgi:hypothetical protein